MCQRRAQWRQRLRRRQQRGQPARGLKIGLAYDTGGRGDRSFNDSAYAGVEAAIEELGGEVKEPEPRTPTPPTAADLLRQLADEGYNPIIGVGFAYGEDVAKVAAQYPDISSRSSTRRPRTANVTGLLFAEEQGSFLVGVAAALKTETGHIGFVGGVDTELIQKFEAGYVAGAKAVNPDIKIDVQYLSPDGDFTGFNDPAKGQIVAQGMYDGGADIVYHAAGGSGPGVFQAAARLGRAGHRRRLRPVPDRRRPGPAGRDHDLDAQAGRQRGAGVHQRLRRRQASRAARTSSTTSRPTASAWPPPAASSTTSRTTRRLPQQIIDGEIEVPTDPVAGPLDGGPGHSARARRTFPGPPGSRRGAGVRQACG